MAKEPKEKKTKEEKKKEKADKKALKKEAKEKAKLKKKNAKGGSVEAEKPPKSKSFFTIKKLIFSVLFVIIFLSIGFFVYKKYFTISDKPIAYKTVILKNVNLPDEMLKFSFNQLNNLYFELVTYNLRVFLLTNEINRIAKIGENYPEQQKITDKEIKDWVKAKENVVKKFLKIETEIKQLFVLYNVNTDDGKKMIEEKQKDLLLQAKDALKTLDPFIEKIKVPEKPPEGFINQTINKIKKIF